MEAWEKHFPGSELPIACYYSNEINNVKFPKAPKPNPRGYTCIFSQIAPVRQGRARAFNMKNLGCFGAFLPLGFDTRVTEEVTTSARWNVLKKAMIMLIACMNTVHPNRLQRNTLCSSVGIHLKNRMIHRWFSSLATRTLSPASILWQILIR